MLNPLSNPSLPWREAKNSEWVEENVDVILFLNVPDRRFKHVLFPSCVGEVESPFGSPTSFPSSYGNNDTGCSRVSFEHRVRKMLHFSDNLKKGASKHNAVLLLFANSIVFASTIDSLVLRTY